MKKHKIKKPKLKINISSKTPVKWRLAKRLIATCKICSVLGEPHSGPVCICCAPVCNRF